jgi:predicted RND superfamily exporter protein
MHLNPTQISNSIVSFKWPIIIATILITGIFASQLSKLTINADIIKSLPDDDKHALLLKHISQNFGGNNMGVIILETDNIYNSDVIRHTRQLTDSIEKIDGIASVSSITNIINIKGSEYGIEIGQLVDEYDIPDTPEAFESLRQNIEANAMYKGSIVSDDETSTLIIFNLMDEANVNAVAKEVLHETEKLNLPETLYYTGSPMLVTYISDLMKRDLTRLLPIAFLVIALILFLSFRNFKGVIFPLLTAVIAIVWSLGSMAVLGFSMSMISNNIPIILLAIGSAYAIHVINRVNQLQIDNTPNAVSTALGYVLIPVILAATTTVIGFVSFVFGAYLEMIVDFGIFTALGTFYACLLSILFVPAALSLKTNKTTEEKNSKKSLFIEIKLLEPLSKLLFRSPKRIVFIWLLCIGVSIFGLLNIERSVDIQEYFKKDNPTRLAEKIMIEKFGGTKPVFVLFKGNMQSPDVLKTMWETAKYMEQSPDIFTSMSIADLIAEINFAITGNRTIPDDPEQIEQLWFLLDGNEILNRFVSKDLSEGIIISKFKSPDNTSKQVFSDYMNDFIAATTNENCIIEITGMPFVDITMDRSLINSQMGSISIAIIFVIIMVGFILRSLKSGVYAAIPIIAAIIILFGVMGLTGISLNIATVLVASVALGIGIDYSIHIISHFNKTYSKTADLHSAIHESIQISGKAIIINVVAVSSGFLVLIFSDMVPLQYFGILIAISMFSSGLGALTLLPAVLILKYRKQSISS